MANVTQRVHLSVVWAFMRIYVCFYYLTRRNFPTALSRQPVSFHHAGRTTLVLETAWWLDVPSHSAACRVGKLFSPCNTASSTLMLPFFSISFLLLLSLAGDHQRQ